MCAAVVYITVVKLLVLLVTIDRMRRALITECGSGEVAE